MSGPLREDVGVARFGMHPAVATLVTCLVACACSPERVVIDGTVIEDVTLISSERPAPLPHASVVIRDGRIVDIGTGLVAGPRARRIDGRGRFLVPGLIDSHVHLDHMAPLDEGAAATRPELVRSFRAQLPRAYLAFGFTTLVDLDLPDPALAWFNAAPVHPRLFHSGRGVRIVGGYMAPSVPAAAAANDANLVYEAAQATRWPAALDPGDYTPARAVDRVVAAGGICVKTFVEPGFGGAAHWPVPRPETLAALRAAARRRGLMLVVHANGVESWRAAVEARADVIAHGLWHWPGDQLGTTPLSEATDVVRAAARAGTWVQPTLQAVYGDQAVFDRSLLDDPRLRAALPSDVVSYLQGAEAYAAWRAIADEYRTAIARVFGPASPDPAAVMAIAPARATTMLKVMLGENVKLLFGTDTPSNEGIGNPPGLNGRLELGRWLDAGVPLPRILRAATLDNAQAFGLSADLGTVSVGKRADLLLLGANPLETIAAYDRIEIVFLNGVPVPRASLLPH
jgi:imidazolonepropionase-like amidohydrolase